MNPKRGSLARTIDLLARVVLVAAALAMLAVAGYAWWDGHLLSPVRTALFAVLPVALGLLCAYAVITAPLARWQIIVNLAAAGVTLLAFELYLRASAQLSVPPQQVTRKVPDLNYLPQVCSTGASKEPLALPDGTPVLPLGGVSKRDILWKGYTLRSDRYGFKNPDAAWDVPAGTALFAGDSFTYGGNAEPDGGFVELVRKSGIPAINLGCGGNGPLAELGTVIEYGHVARPAWIVWVYYEGNDLTKDVQRELKAPLLAAYLKGARQDLAGKQEAIDATLLPFIEKRREAARARQREKKRKKPPAHLKDWRGILGLTFIRGRMGLNYGYPPAALRTFGQVLDRTASLASGLGAKPMFVYLPGEDRYGTIFGAKDAGGYGAAVKRLAQSKGFKVVDIDDAFRATDRDPLSFFDGHYNAEGHAVVARAIAKALTE